MGRIDVRHSSEPHCFFSHTVTGPYFAKKFKSHSGRGVVQSHSSGSARFYKVNSLKQRLQHSNL